MISNYFSGKPLGDEVVGAAIGGAIYGGIATSPLLPKPIGKYINALASYASAFGEATANEIMSVSKKKEISAEIVTCSVKKVLRKTAIEGTQTFITGEIAGSLVKTDRRWFRPKKAKSCFLGKYAKKVWKQSVIQATVGANINVIRHWGYKRWEKLKTYFR